MASINTYIQFSTRTMPAISEDNASTEDSNCDIDDMLDEAMDDSGSVAFTEEGPTPPKNARRSAVSVGTSGASPTSSAASWEFTTPQAGLARRVRVFQLIGPIMSNVDSFNLTDKSMILSASTRFPDSSRRRNGPGLPQGRASADRGPGGEQTPAHGVLLQKAEGQRQRDPVAQGRQKWCHAFDN